MNACTRIFFLSIMLTGLCPAISVAEIPDEINVKKLEQALKEQRQVLDELEKQLKQVDQTKPADEKVSDQAQDKASLIMARHPDAASGRGEDFIDPEFSKSVPLFGSSWRFSVGGYAKTDLIHDFSGTGNKYEFVLATIPVNDNPQPGSYSRLQMNETRFNLELRNQAEGLPANRVFIEFDFFDESNPSSTRLRHAYFEYGNLLAGRTWTTLTELRALPLILDFAAGDSLYGGRTAQLRWQKTDKQFDWAIALEDFNDASVYNPLNLTGVARADFPRLALRGSYSWNQGVITLGSSLAQLRFDGGGGTGDTSELAWAVVTGGRLYFGPGKRHWLGFGGSYGEGTAQNIIAFANGGVPNAAINADGSLELTRNWSALLGVHLKWTDLWSSNISYAAGRISDVPALFDPDYLRDGRAIHANLIYKLSNVVTTGIEFMAGERQNVDGEEGSAERLQASIFYYF